MAAKKGRGYGDVDPEAAPQAQDLAVCLRELMQWAGKKQRDLEGAPTGYGKSRIQEFLSGKAVPQWPFVEKFIVAVVPPRKRAVALDSCRPLWQRAMRPAPAPVVPAAGTDTAAALASVAATAQDQAAQAQEQLALAYQRNEQLSQERDRAQQWVLALSSLTGNLQQQAAALSERRDKEAEAGLARLSAQLETASHELARARVGRNEAEQLAQRLRRRPDELEEKATELRQTGTAPSLSAEFGLPAIPEELKEAFVRADYATVLATAENFLDQGLEMRDGLVDEWGFAAPRRTFAQIIQRWRTASHLLGRALGCLALMSGALAHAAVTRAHASGWTFPLDLMMLAGLLLCADPWEPARRLWPWVRAALRGDRVAGPIRFSAQGAALRAVQCVAAVLAMVGAVLCLTAATDWSGRWLVPLLPGTAAAAVYAVVGRARHLGFVVQQAIVQLAAELQTSRPHLPRTAGQKPALVLTDNGACYKSHLWRETLAQAGITHKRTRPYRPQTNGKVERLNRTLLDEWACARPYRSETERRQAFPHWLHTYNHRRGHTALNGQPPASRVPNLTKQYT